MKINKETGLKVVGILVMVGAGMLVGYSAARFFAQGQAAAPLPWEQKLAVVPIFVVAIFIGLALHELGHVIAGLMVGFKFRMYIVGPLMIEREEGRLRFKWNRNLNLFGGMALCLPQDAWQLARRFIWFASGGPLASLLWTALATGLFFLLNGELIGFWGFATSIFFGLSAVFSGMIFVVTVIPMQAGGFYTDGARVLNLSRGGHQANLEVTLLTLSIQLMSGIRPRELSEPMFLSALALPVETPFKAYLHSILHYHYLYQDKTSLAADQLAHYESYLAKIPTGYQATVWLDKAYFAAMIEQDAAKAQGYFAQAKIGAVITPAKVLRVEAAIALADQNYPLARQKAQQAIQALPKSMDKGTAVAEHEWLADILAQTQQAPIVQ